MDFFNNVLLSQFFGNFLFILATGGVDSLDYKFKLHLHAMSESPESKHRNHCTLAPGYRRLPQVPNAALTLPCVGNKNCGVERVSQLRVIERTPN